MAFAESEKEWAERVARHLKAELKRAGVTYDELARRLRENGFDETKASITNKLPRAASSAHFFLASLTAIGRYSLRVEEISTLLLRCHAGAAACPAFERRAR